VDEAVFGVLDQAPGLEGRFFTLEQELLRPIYAVYQWTPDLTTSLAAPARTGLEKALFSRASHIRATQSPGWEAVLQTLVEEGRLAPKQLQVFDEPDFDWALQSTALSPRLMTLLQADGPHTLAATTFPAKRLAVSRARTNGLEAVKHAWIVIGVIVGAAAFVAICVLVRHWLLIVLLSLLGLSLAVAIMLPSLSRARELSKRIVAAANLKSIDTALQILDTEQTFPTAAQEGNGGSPVIRVREWFPETLLWRPEFITDDAGRVDLEIDLADSITTWRLSASAVSAQGSLGGSSSTIRVFQPFFVDLNLPVALTRGDEVTIPVVVYNYLDRPQAVELTLSDDGWFELLDDTAKHIDLRPGEVKSAGYRVRAKKVGHHELVVEARGSGVADAVKRSVEVVPDGRRIEQVFNGTLQRPADMTLTLPASAIEGSVKAIVKIYPSSFSQLVEGLDAIFRRPYGCFEQTSSTTYPNVLALAYLRRTGQSIPEVEAKARQYIHLGYQRLLGFEVEGGGFDWFGRPPANCTLTAYGLMEFEDMAEVHDVDPNLVDRTRRWLMAQRNSDGSWSPESHRMHVDPTHRGRLATLSTTAYVAWAAFGGGSSATEASATRDYLLSHSPNAIDDPYTLALVSNALLALDPSGVLVRPYLARLDGMKQLSSDGKLTWWDRSPGARTTFYGGGRSGGIETTALAALAMMSANHAPTTIRGALSWLGDQKDSCGTWHSTQATVLALKALLTGTGRPLGGDADRQIEIALGGELTRAVTIPADQADVVRQVDLSGLLAGGQHHLVLSDRSGSGAGYQVAFSYYLPGEQPQGIQKPLSIELQFDRADLHVGDSVTAKATVVNNLPATAPMVILDLPIPAGFTINTTGLDRARETGRIAKFQINPRSAVIYLRQLEPGRPLILEYGLTATMPVRITVPPAHVYEYYDPDTKGASQAKAMRVTQRS
jgi:hypothetical protein